MLPTFRRRDDKQNDPNKYGQQNRQGYWSTKSGQNPNQAPGQQAQNRNQGSQQSDGQQRDPQRGGKRTARFDEQQSSSGSQSAFFDTSHSWAHDALRSMPSEEVAVEHQFFIRQQNLKLHRSLVAASEAAAAKADARQEKL